MCVPGVTSLKKNELKVPITDRGPLSILIVNPFSSSTTRRPRAYLDRSRGRRGGRTVHRRGDRDRVASNNGDRARIVAGHRAVIGDVREPTVWVPASRPSIVRDPFTLMATLEPPSTLREIAIRIG